jgi:hypothetical protein
MNMPANFKGMMMNMAKVYELSDTILYPEAQEFLQNHPDLASDGQPFNRQLMGLMTYSQHWSDLTYYLRHQAGRDWGNKTHYTNFYKALRTYLEDTHTGLRKRAKTEFGLVEDGLGRKAENDALNRYAEVLAQEFVQHLVAHVRFQAATK